MGKDYYKLLGVDKNAGESELKKGVRVRECWRECWLDAQPHALLRTAAATTA